MAFQEPVNLQIGQSLRRADDAVAVSAGQDITLVIISYICAFNKPRLVGLQAADAVTQHFRQHRYNSSRQIYTVTPVLCLGIEGESGGTNKLRRRCERPKASYLPRLSPN